MTIGGLPRFLSRRTVVSTARRAPISSNDLPRVEAPKLQMLTFRTPPYPSRSQVSDAVRAWNTSQAHPYPGVMAVFENAFSEAYVELYRACGSYELIWAGAIGSLSRDVPPDERLKRIGKMAHQAMFGA